MTIHLRSFIALRFISFKFPKLIDAREQRVHTSTSVELVPLTIPLRADAIDFTLDNTEYFISI
jgi:hypothetical protein